MLPLQVGPAWAAQTTALREAHTQPCLLLRAPTETYRRCKPGADEFQVMVWAHDQTSGRPLVLTMLAKNLYITKLGSHKMERYASTANGLEVSAFNLDDAIHSASKGKASFEQLSLLVFCVAESLRNDHFASALEQTFRASRMLVQGFQPRLKLAPWWDLAHQWGQTSDALMAAASARAQAILNRPHSMLTPQERQYREAAAVHALPAHLQQSARTLRVLTNTR